ncbi:MAG: DUF971 domain-containing protein [Burkholderiales bacterium]|nr:DUF971 domain-containing protein [Burkholderiales bacterium]
MSAAQAIALSPERLSVTWEDGESSVQAATLRRACRCAPCQSARLRGTPAEVDGAVQLVDARPVGHYAVQLTFSDGHERGIYPWAYLANLTRGSSMA